MSYNEWPAPERRTMQPRLRAPGVVGILKNFTVTTPYYWGWCEGMPVVVVSQAEWDARTNELEAARCHFFADIKETEEAYEEACDATDAGMGNRGLRELNG